MALFLSESDQNSNEGSEGGGANFVSVPLHGSTRTNGSPKHSEGNSNKPLIEVFIEVLMSSA
jgi:hypothetical protein